ncbi:MAG: hypothetical protein AAGH15_16425, partial [Myxococcota bacterium]
RLLLEGNRTAGLAINGAGSNADLSGLVVRSTEGEEATGARGDGVVVFRASARLERAIVTGNRSAGVVALDSRLTMTDVAILETRAEDCEPSCDDDSTGVASLKALGPQTVVDAVRFRLSGSPETVCGLQLFLRAQVDFMTGLVERHDLGVCLQTPGGYDLRRLANDVAYIDSGRPPVESTDLPVPDLSDAFPPAPDP